MLSVCACPVKGGQKRLYLLRVDTHTMNVKMIVRGEEGKPMQPGYEIRHATVDDAEVITYFRRRMFEDMRYTEYTQSEGIDACYLAWLRAGLTYGRHVGWLVMYEGEVVASAGVELSDVQPHPLTLTTRRAHIVNVYVEPGHRRRGLARALMGAVLDWCAGEDIRVITLQASDEGRPLYESLGFRATREMILVR